LIMYCGNYTKHNGNRAMLEDTAETNTPSTKNFESIKKQLDIFYRSAADRKTLSNYA